MLCGEIFVINIKIKHCVDAGCCIITSCCYQKAAAPAHCSHLIPLLSPPSLCLPHFVFLSTFPTVCIKTFCTFSIPSRTHLDPSSILFPIYNKTCLFSLSSLYTHSSFHKPVIFCPHPSLLLRVIHISYTHRLCFHGASPRFFGEVL